MVKMLGPASLAILMLAFQTHAINIIEGTVYDPHKHPVENLWIELQNEFNMTYGRMRTGPSGRYSFSGMKAGRYQITVYTSGTEFAEVSESVEVLNLVQAASDAVYQDINLKFRQEQPRMEKDPDSIFAQEVPDAARRLFKSGQKSISDHDTAAGRRDLEQAIAIFPNYFDALNLLGCNYVETGEFQNSLKYLLVAIDQNQRSFSSYYALAYAAYKLNQIPDAIEAASAATVLKPGSTNAFLLLGTALRISGAHEKALTVLTKAEQLSQRHPVAEIHWQLALVLNRMHRNNEAADHLEKYLKISENAPNRQQIQTLIAKLRTQKDAKLPDDKEPQ